MLSLMWSKIWMKLPMEKIYDGGSYEQGVEIGKTKLGFAKFKFVL